MDDRDCNVRQQPQRYETMLVVIKAVIFESYRRSFKNPRRINEVNAMKFQIASALLFIPREPNRRIVYTLILFVYAVFPRSNAVLSCPL